MSKRFKVGDRVLMSDNFTKWYLTHRCWECFTSAYGTTSEQYDSIIQLCLMSLMGVPVEGKVTGFGLEDDDGTRFLGVMWSQPGIRYFEHARSKDLLPCK